MTKAKPDRFNEAGEKIDSLGRRIHSSRRGPKPGSSRGGRYATGVLQARVPPDMMQQVDEAAAAAGRTSGRESGRSGIVMEALRLYFYGDAHRWQTRWREERQQRILLQQKLERVREAAS